MITGVIFYEGPSRIDGKPIIGIATFGSHNQKTGNLVQTWILRSDIHPMDAINTGEDASICGSCPLRGLIRPSSEASDKRTVIRTETVNKYRGCYVAVQQAPRAVYAAYHNGNYPKIDSIHAKYMAGHGLRYGSYGDPVAIPMKAWKQLEKMCTGKAVPGYTHQWKSRKFSAWSKKIMASTHSVTENEIAGAKGWRTFRTSVDLNDKAENEIVCPASKAGGNKANCETCGACNGRHSLKDMRKSIVILGHGGTAKLSGLKKFVRSIAE